MWARAELYSTIASTAATCTPAWGTSNAFSNVGSAWSLRDVANARIVREMGCVIKQFTFQRLHGPNVFVDGDPSMESKPPFFVIGHAIKGMGFPEPTRRLTCYQQLPIRLATDSDRHHTTKFAMRFITSEKSMCHAGRFHPDCNGSIGDFQSNPQTHHIEALRPLRSA